jgi:hypothetical protein
LSFEVREREIPISTVDSHDITKIKALKRNFKKRKKKKKKKKKT